MKLIVTFMTTSLWNYNTACVGQAVVLLSKALKKEVQSNSSLNWKNCFFMF